jgi:hypothetical protein
MKRFTLFRDGIVQRFRRFIGTPTGHYVAISLVYLVCISIAEALTTLVEPQLGLPLHGLILVVLLVHGSLIQRGVLRRFLILLSLAPLIRILSLSLPLQKIGLPLIYWYLVIGLLLFLAAFIASRITDLRGNRIGWSWRAWPLQLAIGLMGFGLGYLEYLILQPGPLAAYGSWVDVATAAFILLIFTGVLEEFIFRGLMQSASMQMMGKFGLVYVAILFAVLHLGYHSFPDLLFVLMVGLSFGWWVWKTHSLLGASLAHGIANISLYVLFPMLISAGSLPVVSAGKTVSTPAEPSAPTSTGLVPQGGIIVDNADKGFVFAGKNPWLDATDGFEGSFRWTYAAQSDPDVVATWIPAFPNCGNYRVEAYIPPGIGLTEDARYIIRHAQGISVVAINQAQGEGKWVPMGSYEFEPGVSSNIQLSNGTGEDPKLLRWVAFDAIRWVYQSACSS